MVHILNSGITNYSSSYMVVIYKNNISELEYVKCAGLPLSFQRTTNVN